MKPGMIKIRIRILKDSNNTDESNASIWAKQLKYLARIWDSEQYV